MEIDIDEAAEDFDHLITEEERYRVAMGRQWISAAVGFLGNPYML